MIVASMFMTAYVGVNDAPSWIVLRVSSCVCARENSGACAIAFTIASACYAESGVMAGAMIDHTRADANLPMRARIEARRDAGLRSRDWQHAAWSEQGVIERGELADTLAWNEQGAHRQRLLPSRGERRDVTYQAR